ncbi:cytochrome b5-like heme/steroid binding domain-containing protein [Exophiala viscosa]|uniref:Cytochrome b5-like heme/steroid binding domain-containing protein n=1 Tax=Exophiala viscosa TaxID=2486360 RepID=A0AAN6II22_9EURO|nr:cytochrome b5-like heme/steroid binding domain-containing protein [Exophiala viscosa]KAI1627031.1 cytochrome b5-like heme/steroid binding domain-containing protein [Exophiala viscosa]
MASSDKVKSHKRLRDFSADEVVDHRRKEDLYLVIHGKVYDVTSFVDQHPGGQEVLVDQGGVDATEAFEEVGHSEDAREQLAELIVGNLSRQTGDEKLLASSGSAYKIYHKEPQISALPTWIKTMLVLIVAITVFFGWHFLLP